MTYWLSLTIIIEKKTKLYVTLASGEKSKKKLDDQGQHIYSSALFYCEYLSENRNLDICVADGLNGAIVVLNAVDELRFKNTDPPCLIKEQFHPRCITTDI